MVCCIILAMSSVPSDRQIAEQAIAVFLHHGGIVGERRATTVRPVAPHPADAPLSPIGQRNQQNTSMISNYSQCKLKPCIEITLLDRCLQSPPHA